MSGLNRYTQTVFALNALTNQLKVFGSLAAGASENATNPGTGSSGVQNLSNWESGFYSAVIGNNSPALQDLNSVLYQLSYQIAYMLERGVPAWDSGTTYNIGDIVSSATPSAGSLYVSLINSNTGNAVTTVADWQYIGSGSLQVKSANYQAIPTDGFVEVSTTCTQTLPDATANPGQLITYVKTDSSSTTITFDTQSAQTISGVASGSVFLNVQWSFYSFKSDGTNWVIVAGKPPKLGQQVSSSSNNFAQTVTGTAVAVTNLTVTITTTGRPVALYLQPDGSSNAASLYGEYAASSSIPTLLVQRSSSVIFRSVMGNLSSSYTFAFFPPSMFLGVDIVAAGTYTYSIYINSSNSNACTIGAQYLNLVAYES